MTTSENLNPVRTIHQIVDESGAASKAAHTEPLWVDKNVFSAPTAGNKIVPFTTGEAYFKDLIGACKAAATEIYIAGWQVNWDALLAPGVRLYDVLLDAASRGVKIYVMPWQDSEPIQTYDDQTKVVLEHINEVLKLKGAARRVHVALSPSFASVNAGYFSHHQKQVVIDRKIAYVGGIDLAYGRLDDATFNLQADSGGREMLNRYNPGIPALSEIKKASLTLVDPDLMLGAGDNAGISNPFTDKPIISSNAAVQAKNIAAKGWQIRYDAAQVVSIVMNTPKIAANTSRATALDAKRQPRMPWQDVHCRIEGPAVSHLLRNFVMRWNATSKMKLAPAPLPNKFPPEGQAHIQVLRSSPSLHCAKENVGAASGKSSGTQKDIHAAMLNLIAKARHFIYIENQFFVSNFGTRGGPTDQLSEAGQYIKDGPGGISDLKIKAARMASTGDDKIMDMLPENKVLKGLLARLQKAIVNDIARPRFHVYITLPVHPEGALSDPAIAVQVYYTMQTLVFGSHSLVNGVRRLIKARELKDKKDLDYMRVNKDANKEYESVPVEACNQYFTLLNLRNWTKLGERYVTDQIYVHSKLMIVDDRFALLGSANINDRSLLGERDSELAVLVMDDATKRVDINGKGSNQPVRIFAHEMRKETWKKLFGITGGVRPAVDLARAIEEPGHPDSWKAIQRRAEENARLYDGAFPFIPRNHDPGKKRTAQPARIIPTFDPDIIDARGVRTGGLRTPMPYEEEFWQSPRHTEDASQLGAVRGYITSLPVKWTSGEFLGIRYPTALIVQNMPELDVPAKMSKPAVVASIKSEISPKG